MIEQSSPSAPSSAKTDDLPSVSLLLFLFVTFRVFAAFMLQYGGIFGSSSDFDYYLAIGRLTDTGQWPFLSYWSEYPPVFPAIITTVYRLAEVIARDPPSSAFFITLLRLILLPFEVGNLCLVYLISRQLHGSESASRRAWIYGTLFAPLFVSMGWFDPLPIFLVLLSVKLTISNRGFAAGIAAGLGGATKILPLLVGLVALRRAIDPPSASGRNRFLGFFAGSTAVILGLTLPLAIVNRGLLLMSVRSWVSRPPWESVWALADGYYGFGFVPSLVARTVWPAYFVPSDGQSWLGPVASVTLLAVLAIAFALNWRSNTASGGVAMAGSVLSATFLSATGFSPQFILWTFPFIVILLPLRRAVIYVTALTALVLLGERYLYYWLFPPMQEVLVGLVVIRTALLLLVILELREGASVSLPSAVRVVKRGLTVTVVLGAFVLVLDGAYLYALGGWGTTVLEDPARVSASELHRVSDQRDALLTVDRERFRNIGPWISDRALYLVGASDLAVDLKRETVLRDVAAGHPTILVLEGSSPSVAEEQLEGWLARAGLDLGVTTLKKTGIRLHRYVVPQGLAAPASGPDVDQRDAVGSGVILLGYTVVGTGISGTASHAIHLRLYWRKDEASSTQPILRLGIVTKGPQSLKSWNTQINSTYPVGRWNVGQVVVDDEEIIVDDATPDFSAPVSVELVDANTASQSSNATTPRQNLLRGLRVEHSGGRLAVSQATE